MNKALNYITKPVHIAPLVIFRIVFGAILFFSTLRFIAKGWVHDLYVEPNFFFSYYGFEWAKPFSEPLMYALFGLLAIAFLFQTLGLFYKASSVISFSLFTYIELIDKTNYLNHYYFVSLVLLLLIFVPAHRFFSLDVKRNPDLKRTQLPNYFILIFQLQLGIVYFYAGLAKLNYDWLVNTMPLKIWLPSKANLPLIGSFLQQEWVAYLASWFGAVYDLSIPFLLLNRKTRWWAYFFVIVFHVATYLLFQIGMFPFIMIGATLIFFSEDFHLKLIGAFRYNSTEVESPNAPTKSLSTPAFSLQKPLLIFLSLFFVLQLFIPFRYLLYPNNLYWAEEGYRFSWRVMLMEKAGYAIFHIEDPATQRKWEVNNYEHLSPNQEKMMSTQADMILQFAHYLENFYQAQGIENPKITAEVYVTLNGKRSKLFIDPTVDLTQIKESFAPKSWILPFQNDSIKPIPSTN